MCARLFGWDQQGSAETELPTATAAPAHSHAITCTCFLLLPPCSPILLFQFVYKTIFFFKSTLPALRRNKPADRPAIKMGERVGAVQASRREAAAAWWLNRKHAPGGHSLCACA